MESFDFLGSSTMGLSGMLVECVGGGSNGVVSLSLVSLIIIFYLLSTIQSTFLDFNRSKEKWQ